MLTGLDHLYSLVSRKVKIIAVQAIGIRVCIADLSVLLKKANKSIFSWELRLRGKIAGSFHDHRIACTAPAALIFL